MSLVEYSLSDDSEEEEEEAFMEEDEAEGEAEGEDEGEEEGEAEGEEEDGSSSVSSPEQPADDDDEDMTLDALFRAALEREGLEYPADKDMDTDSKYFYEQTEEVQAQIVRALEKSSENGRFSADAETIVLPTPWPVPNSDGTHIWTVFACRLMEFERVSRCAPIGVVCAAAHVRSRHMCAARHTCVHSGTHDLGRSSARWHHLPLCHHLLPHIPLTTACPQSPQLL